MTKNTVRLATEAAAITRAAIRAWHTNARSNARGMHEIDVVDNAGMQAMDALGKFRGALLPFGLMSKDTAESHASVAEAVDAAAQAVSDAHAARQLGVSSQRSYAQSGDLLDAGRAFMYLRVKLGALGIQSGTARP
jgi:hypothetical protein